MTKDTQSTTYYFSVDNTPTHEDDWTVQQGESGDYWSYTFAPEDGQPLLDYYLGEADQIEVDNLCQILMMGGTASQSFHHALFSVLKEFR